MTIILFAIPAFFLLIAIELVVDRIRRTGYYTLSDAVSSLSVGMMSRVATLLYTLIPLSIYALIVEDIALFSWPTGLLGWVVAFVLYDFLYYWNHRLGHEVAVLWAAHVVHHSSEEYNLTTALRQTSGSILNWIFFIPLALIGVPLEMMLSIAALNLVYQFWVHTRHVGKLGIWDRILVTPSNHRVHHAQNQRYIDKNYGGVFILWDRLFGTFQDEIDTDPPVYGIRSALRSYNPIRANIQVYRQLLSDSWHTVHWNDKFKVWFARTGWRPQDISASLPAKPAFDATNFSKFVVPITPQRSVYALLQLFLSFALTLSVLLTIDVLEPAQILAWALVLFCSLVSIGLLLEDHALARWAETTKWLLVVSALMFLPQQSWLAPAFAALLVMHLVWLMWKWSDPARRINRI
ncbi:sterol desaturase family protein [Alteromonas oceanisediminis]|uniref:sterol desaturase family protein n=1 Tax=Alteromonas oceanisediminis TaxID=2836180 RepID=UPI001BD9B1F3|nr:sterol desaturase family protein [Alteromonas oceanisediminis]MBT0587905.1 sterol desaturase family protein [Alteromonas oceanisediminis]